MGKAGRPITASPFPPITAPRGIPQDKSTTSRPRRPWACSAHGSTTCGLMRLFSPGATSSWIAAASSLASSHPPPAPRVPPTWRAPTPSTPSSKTTPATASASYLDAANAIHLQQPDHTSHRICEFLLPGGRQSHPSPAARSHQPSYELEPKGRYRLRNVTKSRHRPYRSPPTCTLHNYYRPS